MLLNFIVCFYFVKLSAQLKAAAVRKTESLISSIPMTFGVRKAVWNGDWEIRFTVKFPTLSRLIQRLKGQNLHLVKGTHVCAIVVLSFRVEDFRWRVGSGKQNECRDNENNNSEIHRWGLWVTNKNLKLIDEWVEYFELENIFLKLINQFSGERRNILLPKSLKWILFSLSWRRRLSVYWNFQRIIILSR